MVVYGVVTRVEVSSRRSCLRRLSELDLSSFYVSYRHDGHGPAAHDPAMMVALLLYAYCGSGSRGSERASGPDDHPRQSETASCTPAAPGCDLTALRNSCPPSKPRRRACVSVDGRIGSESRSEQVATRPIVTSPPRRA